MAPVHHRSPTFLQTLGNYSQSVILPVSSGGAPVFNFRGMFDQHLGEMSCIGRQKGSVLRKFFLHFGELSGAALQVKNIRKFDKPWCVGWCGTPEAKLQKKFEPKFGALDGAACQKLFGTDFQG
ncbi:hypothetical protein HAX54_044051 [Datura stramonium]|uniref:Uncharacterized protein n=1 Tax=Datura stramonium TaxID=4076 RepID=A0ABS8W6I9_DATST|nr:hypothetical protein [Datura stramonium]